MDSTNFDKHDDEYQTHLSEAHIKYEKLKKTLSARIQELEDCKKQLLEKNKTLTRSNDQILTDFNKYKSFFLNSPLAYQSLGPSGNIIDVNPAWLHILGYDKSEVIGKWFGNFLSKLDIDNFKKNFEIFKQKGSLNDIHYSMKKKNGTEIHVSFDGCVSYSEEGEFEQTFCIFKDITEQRNLQEEMLLKQRRFNLMMDATSDGLWDLNLETNEIYYSSGWKRMLGYGKDELENDFSVWEELTHPDDVKQAWKVLKELLDEKREKFEAELRMKHKSGHWVHVLSRANVTRNAKGKAIQLIGSHVDISERKKAEEAIRNSGERFNKVLQAIPDMVSIHDREMNIVYSNWNGFGEVPVEKQILNSKCYKTYRDFDTICPDCQAKTVLKTNKPFETTAELPNGIWVDIRVLPVSEQNGECELFVEWVRDITDIKKSELKLKETNEEYETLNEELNEINQDLLLAKEKAEESDRLKTIFLNNMSHEIRTPMNGIIGFTKFLDNPDLTPEKRKYYTRIIINSSQQLLQIINDILEISTLETKKVKINNEKFVLNDLLMDIFSVFDMRAKEINLPFYLNKGLPDEKSMIISDKLKLHKILGNLIENALKYTRNGFIELGYKVKGDMLEIYVKDTGIGIAPENRENVFKRFIQENNEASSKTGGLGIGLSIAKENAELMGGTIKLDSKKDIGSIFHVIIPFIPVYSEVIQANDDTGAKCTKRDKPFLILIAEDEEINYLYIETILQKEESFKCEIMHARNGKEAVELCKNNHFDLVLMDIKMSMMNGIEATKEIRDEYPDLVIIAQTAYTSAQDKQNALKAGCNDFITKPINNQELFQKINKFLSYKGNKF